MGTMPATGLTSRRQLLRAGGLSALGWSAADWLTCSPVLQAAAAGEPDLQPLNRFPRVVQEYFVRQVRQAEAAAERARSELETPDDARAYIASVRERVGQCFGPWPERTPLEARVTGQVERDAYRIEKVVFESRPGFLVTGNLYVPRDRARPRPGVVGVCGHSSNGKAAEAYQSFSQGLARLGYVVLIIDPIGQGERSQYVRVTDGIPTDVIRVGVPQHLLAGNQQFLVGEFLGAWRAWDGIRALDYLLTREEVDPRYVGITGNSGGGTMTTWLCGVEPRWTMAAPSCFVTTFRRNLENELPADTEQCPPGAVRRRLDHSDFLAAMAPKPILILAQERDYFDVRGAVEAFARLQQLYTLLGQPDNIRLFVGPNEHGYSRENREAMYAWFHRVTGQPEAPTEPPLNIEPDQELYCAPRGQVALLGSKTVFDFTRDRSQSLRTTRRSLQGPALQRAVTRMLRLKQWNGVCDYRILRPAGPRGYPAEHFTTYALETEPGIQVVVYRLADDRLLSRPIPASNRAVLYIPHQSSDAELRGDDFVKQLITDEPQAVVFTCDVRGLGESRPDTTNPDSFLKPYGSDYFYAIHSIMLERPYVGQRTYDILRTLNWLADVGHTEVHLAAKGWGSVPATFAALLSDHVTQVTLKNALTSYAELAEHAYYQWPLSSLVPDVLQRFDLPDCYAALGAKRLRQVDPHGAAPTSQTTG
jgi:cephalosporin-C deacetylase-like acetyl esterase